VRVCALEWDFRLLPHGNRIIVRERGVTLSSGEMVTILQDELFENVRFGILFTQLVSA
jgi:hypothetical protein